MTGELYLDPQRATAAGRDLSAAGKHLVSLNNSAVAEVAAASQGQPWGRDDIGAAFQKNYGPLLQQFTDAFGKIAGYAALGAFIAAAVMLLLVLLGLRHLRQLERRVA